MKFDCSQISIQRKETQHQTQDNQFNDILLTPAHCTKDIFVLGRMQQKHRSVG